MSTKQAAFIRTLIAERNLDAGNERRVQILRDMHAAGQPIPSDAASILIGELLKAPRKAAAATAPALGTYHLPDGRIVRIVENREKTRRYGKVWDEDTESWEYLPGLGRLVQDLTPLTLAEAEAFGIRTGNCAICGRTLTRSDSIARGIGPVCASQF